MPHSSRGLSPVTGEVQAVSAPIDFLSVTSDERLRHEAGNILDSYANPWDILAEALQNAVDAVEQRVEAEPDAPTEIAIDFNSRRRSVCVVDSGVGMSRDQLTRVLTPHISLKRGDARTRGEKGIGLSFLVLSSNEFEMLTCDGSECTVARIEGAADWARGLSEERPKLLVDEGEAPDAPPFETFTRLSLRRISSATDDETDLFDYTLPRLLHVLRTRTAIGNTRPLFSKDARPEVDIDVELTYTDANGSKSEGVHVDFSYATPGAYLDPSELLEFGDYQELLKQKKERRVRGRSLVYREVLTSDSGRPLRCYAFASSRSTYNAISKRYELMSGDEPDIQASVYVATRSMPTGIQVQPRKTTAAGYWENLYIVIEDDGLKFDLGRKSFRGRQVAMFRDAAERIFRSLVNHIPDVIPETHAPIMRRKQELASAWEDAKGMPDLGVPSLAYLKAPSHEQGVVALFYELTGRGVIKGYRTCRNSSRDQYDALVSYRIAKDEIGRNEAAVVKGTNISNDIVVEFKLDGADLIADIDTDRKKYEDLNLLVCWDIADRRALRKEGIEVEDVTSSDVYFYSTTHRILFPPYFSLGTSSTLPVIALRQIVEGLKKPKARRKVRRRRTR